MSSTNFKKIVWAFYKKDGRYELPWRKTHDPYKILVSEVMLQQTQVERVIPFYQNFIKQFPTARALSRAPLAEVLKSWQGLGYNRRAKMLHECAKEIVGKYRNKFPRSVEALETLPGIGPYTARALAAFAYNQEVIFVETNIRTAVLHHFFSRRSDIEDTDLVEVLRRVHPKGRAREWYSALMDYGAFLKKSGVKLNAKSKHYMKQSRFAGSNREARGAILKELACGSRSEPRLLGLLGPDRVQQLQEALVALLSEKLIEKRGKAFALPR